MEKISQDLKEGTFIRFLVKKSPRGYDELLSRAKKYINIEEAQKARQTLKGSASILVEKNNLVQQALPKLDHVKSFSMEVPRGIALGVMAIEYPPRQESLGVRGNREGDVLL